MGWSIEHGRPAATLGPVSRFLGRAISRRAFAPERALSRCARLRRAHHVNDRAAFHDDAASRAATLAMLASSGAVVRLTDSDPELVEHLGEELLHLMADPRITEADSHQRELLSIAMRRAALRTRSRLALARLSSASPAATSAADIGEGSADAGAHIGDDSADAGADIIEGSEDDVDGPGWPKVSVLLATRRPERLAAAAASVSAQTYPNVELVLAPHGEGFDAAEIRSVVSEFPRPALVVPVSGRQPLGAVLNAAADASDGALVTKFDDDDHYDAEHVWDLVLALEYSQAEIVGKGSEYVYLARPDCTVRRFPGEGERYAEHGRGMAGGTLMVRRGCLRAVGGWKPIPSAVDWELLQSARRRGKPIYRTHGAGYLLVRHGLDHTWQADDGEFLRQAHQTRPGCALEFAGIRSSG